MEPVFHDSHRSVQLTVVCGVGTFGKSVLDLVEEHLSVMPTAIQCATSCAQFDTIAEVTEKLGPLRRALATDETTQQIESFGWRRAGLDLGVMRVHHLLVLSVDEISPAEVARVLIPETLRESRDLFTGIFLVSSNQEHLPVLKEIQIRMRKLVVSGRRSTGEHVMENDVQSSVAGFMLSSLLPEMSGATSIDLGETTLGTFGFSGLYGIAGPALTRLAEHTAYAVLDEHLRDVKFLDGNEALPTAVEAFLDRFSPHALGTALFDPSYQPEMRPARIPAVPRWQGDVFSVQLDRADKSLDQIEEQRARELVSGKERMWSAALRRHARLFDMTLSYKWNRQLESASKALMAMIRESVGPQFADLLRSLPYAPAYAGHVLQVLDTAISTRYRSSERFDYTEEEFEDALDELDAAAATKPNAIALSLRLALWLVPALVAGALILNGLYDDARGWLFPVLYIAVAAGGALTWLVWALKQAHRRIRTARDRAIDIMLTRQETILAENAIGYQAEVIPVLQEELESKARPAFTAYAAGLHRERDTVGSTLETALHAPLTFQPILSTPEAYRTAFEKLKIDQAAWLADAVEEGLLDPTLLEADDEHALSTRALTWCRRHLSEGRRLSVLDYEQLWAIRNGDTEADARQTEALDQTISQLWQLSAPLIEYTYAPEPDRQHHVVLTPTDLVARFHRLSSSQRLFDQGDIREVQDTPLLCFLRTGTLSNL